MAVCNYKDHRSKQNKINDVTCVNAIYKFCVIQLVTCLERDTVL